MDPLSGLLLMIEALADGEHDDCEDRCAAYKTWRAARGYKPILLALDDCCDPASPYHVQFPIAQYAATHGLPLDADVIANHVRVALYEARS